MLGPHIAEAHGETGAALENAVSVAGVLLLTEATMTAIPEPKIAPMASATGMD